MCAAELEGLPLGIELASALLRVMSCQELSREIEHNLDILESSQRDLPDRHRSLRGVFEYSWRLLDDAAKRAFRRLSVFHGSFGKLAAQEVADVGLMLLAELVDKSLLIRHVEGTFFIHGLLRHFAADKLAADEIELREMNRKHCQFHLHLLQDAERISASDEQATGRRKCAAKWRTCAQAWQWAADNDEDQLLTRMRFPGFLNS